MDDKTNFEPLRNERAFESIVRQIREGIYSRRLNPGDKLPTERELAQIFNTSRVSVRSALLNLEQSGLLSIRKGAGGGFFIRELDFKPVRDSLNDLLKLGKASVADLTDARIILEPQVAALAARRGSLNDFRRTERAILDFQERMSQNLPPDPSDLSFHVCVAEASKNPVTILVMRSLMEFLFESIGSYFLTPDATKKIVNQHKRILEAIRRKDAENAQVLMLRHVRTMRTLFRNYEIGLNQIAENR